MDPEATGEPTAVAGDGDETIVVADAGPSRAGGLAWSSEDTAEDSDAPAEQRSWGAAWAHAIVFILCAAMVATVIVAVGWALVEDHGTQVSTPPPTSVVAKPAPVSSAAPSPAAPAPSGPDDTIMPSTAAPTSTVTVTQTPDPQAAATVTAETPPPPPVAPAPRYSGTDEAFMAALREDGIIVSNPTEVIANAHAVCQYIAAGHTAHEAMRSVMADNRTLTLENAATLIGAAIGAYCPQYTGM
jgi:hypothetical protein